MHIRTIGLAVLASLLLVSAGPAQNLTRNAGVSEMLAHAHVPTLDPQSMSRDEIVSALGTDSYCAFSYMSYSEPVFAVSADADGEAAVKVNGDLLVLPLSADENALSASQDSLRIAVEGVSTDMAGQREATLTFAIGEELDAGYRGFFDCRK